MTNSKMLPGFQKGLLLEQDNLKHKFRRKTSQIN